MTHDGRAGAVTAERELGGTGLRVPALCFGTSALGDMPAVYGFGTDEDVALATLRAIFAGPVRFLDTANCYGDAERRIGVVLRELGGLPGGFVLSTKCDPDETGDYSGSRVLRSVEQSMERLGVDHLQLLYLHDPEKTDYDGSLAPDGAVPALLRLKEQGVVDHLGVAGGPIGLMRRYVGTGLFEVAITHNRYTLLDRSAEPLLDDCAAAGVALVNAAPFASGMLAKGPSAGVRYAYHDAPPGIVERVRAIEAACAAYDVPMAAAALGFSLRDPRVAATLVGVTKPERVHQTLELADTDVPADLWAELAELAAPESLWLR